MSKTYYSRPVAVEAVQLRASEPGEPLSFNEMPDWLDTLFGSNKIRQQVGDRIDGSDWMYLWLDTGVADVLVKTDDWIVYDAGSGKVGVISSNLFNALYLS